MIVVHDQDPLGDKHITFYVNEVPRRYNRLITYRTIILNNNRSFSGGVHLGYIEPGILSEGDRITQTNSGRVSSTDSTRDMQI